MGSRVFRNNTGTGWVGKADRSGMPNRLLLYSPRPLRAGLVKGSSDLIGWTPVEITQDMVGTTVAVFTALEVKTGRQKATETQTIFINNVRDAGGFSGVVHDADEAMEIINTKSQ